MKCPVKLYEHFPNWFLKELRKAITREDNKNSKGEIRTLDLTGMSRALSPAELPCHLSH